MTDWDWIEQQAREARANLQKCQAPPDVFLEIAETGKAQEKALADARAAIEAMQAAHEAQLTRMAKERAKAERKIERLQTALEAVQRPPLGYVVGRHLIDGWTFNRFYGGPESMRAGAEQELAAQVEEDGLAKEWKILEVREAQP